MIFAPKSDNKIRSIRVRLEEKDLGMLECQSLLELERRIARADTPAAEFGEYLHIFMDG